MGPLQRLTARNDDDVKLRAPLGRFISSVQVRASIKVHVTDGCKYAILSRNIYGPSQCEAPGDRERVDGPNKFPRHWAPLSVT